jgi:hypothetical protein
METQADIVCAPGAQAVIAPKVFKRGAMMHYGATTVLF